MHPTSGRRVQRRLSASLIAWLGLLPSCSQDVESAHSRPNIVLIVTDDQASSTLSYMPHLEKHLVEEGTTFENFVLNDPICCPSRVTILLGQYRHNHQLETSTRGCATQFYHDARHPRAFAALMRKAGMRTGLVGKYLNSYDGYFSRLPEDAGNPLLEGWDDYRVVTGETRYYDFEIHENGEVVRHSKPIHQTDVLSRLAQDFIAVSAREGSPFLLYVATQAPHSPAVPARRHERVALDARVPRGPSFNQSDVSTQPSLRTTVPLSPAMVRRADLRFRLHVQTLQSVDELVRDIVETLERTNQLERTFIFYTSDNGHHFGEHRIAHGKGTPFEESVRFPLIVRGPEVPAGVSLPHLVSNVDLHPTLLDLIGEEPGPQVDGRSLVPLLTRGAADSPGRQALVIESSHGQRNQGIPVFAGIRTARYKLVEYGNVERELYDLRVDPHETRNVVDSTDPAIVDALSQRLTRLLRCSGAPCQEVEDAPLEWDSADENRRSPAKPSAQRGS